jgi:hypothetical protein
MSTLKVSTLQNASSATANITLDTAGNATVGGTLAMGSSFLRNRLINGGMQLDQRNAGASQTITAAAALAYTVDRWYAYCTGANVTGQRVANTGTTASPAQNAYQFTGAASVTAIGFGQRIEAVNSFDLANQTATLSVNLANSVLTTVTWTAYYANTADTFGTLASPTVTQIATGTFTVSSTLTRYSTNISIPSAATTGIQILFTVGAQTSGTWTIGNVQLERDSVATPFERRQYGQELALCQRYYRKYNNSGSSYTSFATGINQSTNAINRMGFSLDTPMRVAPTVSITNCVGWNGNVGGAASVATSYNTTNNLDFDITTSGLTGAGTGIVGKLLMASNGYVELTGAEL